MATGSTSTGFLNAISGAKFTAWLKEVSRPECDGDDRAPAARRVDAFDRLLDDTAQTGTTQTGAPAGESTETTESMRRPRRADTRLLVLADLETLLRLPGAAQATLAGFGHIGTDLLGSLTCAAGAEATTRSAMAHGTPSGSGLSPGEERIYEFIHRHVPEPHLSPMGPQSAGPSARLGSSWWHLVS